MSPQPFAEQWQLHVPQNTCGMGDSFGTIMSSWLGPHNATASTGATSTAATVAGDGKVDNLAGLLQHFGPDPFPPDTCSQGLDWLARHHRHANGSAIEHEYFAILCAAPEKHDCCARSLLLLTHEEGAKWDIRICGTVD